MDSEADVMEIASDAMEILQEKSPSRKLLGMMILLEHDLCDLTIPGNKRREIMKLWDDMKETFEIEIENKLVVRKSEDGKSVANFPYAHVNSK